MAVLYTCTLSEFNSTATKRETWQHCGTLSVTVRTKTAVKTDEETKWKIQRETTEKYVINEVYIGIFYL
jgi:hypothetical protein